MGMDSKINVDVCLHQNFSKAGQFDGRCYGKWPLTAWESSSKQVKDGCKGLTAHKGAVSFGASR